jgi:pimeloyl-ACP methyl ester carboxylesterase
MSLFLVLAITGFLFLATVTLILLLIGPTLLLRPKRRTADYYRALGAPTRPEDLGLPCEPIFIGTDDGLTLSAWVVRAAPPVRGTIIYLHGVGDCKIDGLRAAELFHSQHYTTVLYDSRRHGESGGRFCTYGFYEKFDVMRVIDAVVRNDRQSGGPVGLFGTSMGAAVALQAAALDRRISAVAAENSFATLRSIFDDYQKRMIKLPFHYLRNLVIVRSEFLADFKASDVSPLEAVGKIRIPLLFTYSEHDVRIRPEYSRQLFAAASGPKAIYPVPGAAHNNTWDIGGGSYKEMVLNFFLTSLR